MTSGRPWPFVLRLRRTDRLRLIDDGSRPRSPLEPPAAELSAEVRVRAVRSPRCSAGVRPVFGDSAAARAALPELLGPGRTVPNGHRTILAPLRGRRRVIGAAVFVRRPDRPAFEPDDLLVAAQLATHTALGIDKAVLYGREAYIADELQRTMLPDSLPQPTGVRLASRYLPAAETARVGGDWYDAIPLPGSRVALVVGDVMGHSMTSAAIMGQFGPPRRPWPAGPAARRRSCTTSTSRPSGSAVTAWRPACTPCTTRWHTGSPSPTPAIRRPSCCIWAAAPRCCGSRRALRSASAAWTSRRSSWTHRPVRPCCSTRTVWSSPGCVTSGRVSSSSASGSPPPPRLTGPDHAPPLEALCDDVLDMLGPGDRDDDIALLAARFDGIAPSDVAYWFLDPEDAGPGPGPPGWSAGPCSAGTWKT